MVWVSGPIKSALSPDYFIRLTIVQSPMTPAADIAPAIVTIENVFWLLLSPLLPLTAPLRRPCSSVVVPESKASGSVASTKKVKSRPDS